MDSKFTTLAFMPLNLRLMAVICLFLICFYGESPMSYGSYGSVTANVLLRTKWIKFGLETGTAFTIDVDGKQYLLTAKHLLKGVADGSTATIQISKNKTWVDLSVKVLQCADPVDIAVLVPPKQLTVTHPLTPASDGVFMGEDVWFVGFPFAMPAIFGNTAGDIGIARRAMVAQFDLQPTIKATRFLLDGVNNPGFSGSPVVWGSPTDLKVAAVISGVVEQRLPVMRTKSITSAEITPSDLVQDRIIRDGSNTYRLEDTDLTVKVNSGIAYAWSINPALELIKKNPIGPQVDPAFTE